MAVKDTHPSGHLRSPDPDALCEGRGGFTMVEVIIAVVILAVGLMGMAGTTALVVRQVSLADVTTERSAVLQSTIERLRALPFTSLADGTDSVGAFQVSWTVTNPDGRWASVQIVTTGPGVRTANGEFPMLNPSVPDTFTYRILR